MENSEDLDKEILQDVDKVYTTIKEDTISDTDLDFIDELNNIDDDNLLNSEENDIIDLEDFSNSEDILESFDENITEEKINIEDKEILETKNSSTPIVPVYNAEIPSEDLVISDPIEQGDVVVHAKYGNGIVEKMIKYGTKTLYSINFDNIGRRLLDPTLTEIKKS